jgi:hypothetical protein
MLPASAFAFILIACLSPRAEAGKLPPYLTEHRTTLPCGKEQAGYLVEPVCDAGNGPKLRLEPYFPQPGDLKHYDSPNPIFHYIFALVRSDTPIHAAIVVERADGTPAILEVGPNSTPQAFTSTYIVDVWPRFESYPGIVMIRRPHCRLTPERSAELTKFALAQEGKDFAVGRLALQLSPFNCRHGLRHLLFAHTYFDRGRWICSENAVAAATVAGLCDPKRHPANCMYPRDLAFDEDYDLSETYGPLRLWVRDPNVEIDGDHLRAVIHNHSSW